MSIHSITCDEFFELTAAHHRTALRLFSAEIDALIAQLAAAPDKQAPAYEADSDELGRLLTLRKLHRVRLAELVADAAHVPAPDAATQYEHHERHDLAA